MNFIVGRHFQKDTDEYKRAYFFSLNVFAIFILALFFNIVVLFSNVYNNLNLYTPMILLSIVVFIILYFKGNLRLCVNLVCIGSYMILLNPILVTGGISSHFVIWLLLPPIAALTTGFVKDGTFWLVFAIIYQIAIFTFDKTTYNARFIEVDKLFLLINQIAYFLILFCIVIVYEKLKVQQQNIIQNHVEDLITQRKVLTQKNNELERFAFIASHDLRTPLRNIISFTTLLGRKLKDTNDINIKEYMGFIKDYSYHMNHIVDNILEFARIGKEEHEKIEIVDLEDVKNIVLKSLNDKISERKAVVHTEGGLPKVNGDKTQLIQLMQNLIENALTYNEQPQPQIEIGIRDSTELGKSIYVKDNGIGIDEEYQEKVFEMFTRLHSLDKYKGTGLGLAICKKIVMQYGGRIWIDSKLEKGTTINFMLPIAA